MGQLPLALGLADHARFETFVDGANGSAVRHARAVADGAPDTVWISGPHASGKTHLLQAACRSASLTGRRAMYVALLEEHAVEPELLAGLEGVDSAFTALKDPEKHAKILINPSSTAIAPGG